MIFLALLLDVSSETRTDITFLSMPDPGIVRAVDSAGKTIWERRQIGKWPMGLWPTSRGGCYVGIDSGIVELDRNGREIRRIAFRQWGSGRYVTSLQPLAGNRFLLVDYNPGALVEIDEKGKIWWQPKQGTYYDARRLRDGTTIAVGPKKFTVFDRGGEVLREVPLEGIGVWVEPLRNGHVLVALDDRSEILELTPEGKTVRVIQGVERPYSAFPAGRGILVAEFDKFRVSEIGRKGFVLENLPGRVRMAVRYRP